MTLDQGNAGSGLALVPLPSIATDILAVDGPTAVVRAEVRYGDPLRQEYRDLWILHLNGSGRCTSFEEWPYWPGQARAATA
jgi:hypothetical protein